MKRATMNIPDFLLLKMDWNRYSFRAMDPFTKWPEDDAIPDQEISTTAKVVVIFFGVFGVSIELHCARKGILNPRFSRSASSSWVLGRPETPFYTRSEMEWWRDFIGRWVRSFLRCLWFIEQHRRYHWVLASEADVWE